MRTYVATFVLSLLGAAALTPAVRQLARSIGAIDRARSSRRIHTGLIPRLGGVAIVIAFYLPVCGLLLFDNLIAQAFKADRGLVLGLLAGGLAITLLGVYDDLRGANAWKKFGVQFLVAGFMYFVGFRIQIVSTPFGGELSLGWLGLPLTLLWIVGVVNAMNLIDGLDGLAGGVAFFAVLTAFAVSFQRGETLLIVFTAALAGAILGFLFYNFNPATIFMGDTGSMFLGFVLAVTSIKASQKSATTVAILVPIVALGLPIMDTALAMTRRIVRGQSPFTADKDHIHHRLLKHGLSQRAATLVLYGVSIVLGLTAFAIAFARGRETGILLAVIGVATLVFVRWLGYGVTRMADWRKSLEQRRRNRERFRAVRTAGHALEPAASLEEVFAALKPFVAVVEATSLTVGAAGAQLVCGIRGPVRLALPIENEHNAIGQLELTWADGREEIDRDDEIAVEMLLPALTTAVRRLGLSQGAQVLSFRR
jgi:UDP-GlcNAc:undecaprenyl-phosphate GlcNAc-1-phosphate transferase